MKLLGLSGSLTPRSKTLIAVEETLHAAESLSGHVHTECVNLRDLELEFCDGRDPKLYGGDTGRLIKKIAQADGLIVGTPIYRGSYTGALKNVLDIIPADALKGKVVGLIATGGTYHHFLAIEHQLKPLFGFFQSHIVPEAVYAHDAHFENKVLVDGEIKQRLHELARNVIDLYSKLNQKVVLL